MVRAKQDEQKQHHDRHAKERQLSLGQKVYAKNFRPGPTWVPAIVRKLLGPLTYLVEVEQRQHWRHHIDHLHPRDSEETNRTESTDDFGYPKPEAASTPTEPVEQDTMEHHSDTEDRRYPVRERHPPARLMRLRNYHLIVLFL